ncbi:MAG: hypothetical protein CME70_15330 [Halobacteriovorax sp.]|nr:hypothetical protein [Halobacteriovorax sp.]|tara:strand:+ start:64670 stop:65071 length:402 start_codon:yes stop_codon:yes gene_type:complete
MDSERLKNYAEKKFGHKVRRIIENPQNIINEIASASQLLLKDKIVSGLKGGYEDFLTLLRLLKAWGVGEYKEVPWRTLWLSILAVIYFVSVVDLIPDFILGVGFVDDFALITWVLGSIKADLDRFKEFENQKE